MVLLSDLLRLFSPLHAILSNDVALLIGSVMVHSVLALPPALIAWRKGRSAAGFGLYGFLLWPVALVHALMLRPTAACQEARELASGERRRCPACQEVVRSEARRCKHCYEALEPLTPEPTVRDAVRLLTEEKGGAR
jgi:hypothetical protein